MLKARPQPGRAALAASRDGPSAASLQGARSSLGIIAFATAAPLSLMVGLG
jgi:hypothetical protein